MPRNDDMSLILAKAYKAGFFEDVKSYEVDALQQFANDLFGDDKALVGKSSLRLGLTPTSAGERRRVVPTIMATPPTVSYSTYPYGPSSIANGVPILITDPRLRVTGGVLDPSPGVGTNGTQYYQASYTNGIGMLRIEFDTDASAFEIDQMRNANLQIVVDGQFISATPTLYTVTGNSQYYIRIDFGSRKPRRIVIYTAGQLSRLMINQADTIWPPTTPRTPRFRSISDSIGQTANTLLPTGGPYLQAALMLGWEDIELSAVGGTGFLNPGVGLTTFRQRIQADILNRNPEIIGIFGGINDTGRQTKAVIQAEITATIKQCRDNAKSALIIGSGPWEPKSSTAIDGRYTDIRDAFLASMQTIIGPWIFIDPLTGGWTTSNGNTGAATSPWITGEGNTQFRTVTDGVTTNASTTVTSATAAFVAGDVGHIITGAGIPTGVTISSVTNATTAVLSAAATATATAVTFNITSQTGSGNADLYISDGTHPNAAGATYAANRLASSISAALETF